MDAVSGVGMMLLMQILLSFSRMVPLDDRAHQQVT